MDTLVTIEGERNLFARPELILVATDLTDGEVLIAHAVAQARASGARVRLVHAIAPCESISIDAGAVPYYSSLEVEEQAMRSLRTIAGAIAAQGIRCETAWGYGLPADVVEDEIALSGATRLVMASHGRGKLGQFLMGSVANQLLGTVSIPVFLVGPRAISSTARATPRRILHPVSMKGEYREAARVAIELARQYRAELTILHIPDGRSEESLHPGCTLCWAKNLFAKLVPEGAEIVPRLRIDLAFGEKVEQIRLAARRIDADWIVMGVDEGFSLWPMLESTAYRVLAVADCPVLAVRRGAACPARQETVRLGVGAHGELPEVANRV